MIETIKTAAKAAAAYLAGFLVIVALSVGAYNLHWAIMLALCGLVAFMLIWILLGVKPWNPRYESLLLAPGLLFSSLMLYAELMPLPEAVPLAAGFWSAFFIGLAFYVLLRVRASKSGGDNQRSDVTPPPAVPRPRQGPR